MLIQSQYLISGKLYTFTIALLSDPGCNYNSCYSHSQHFVCQSSENNVYRSVSQSVLIKGKGKINLSLCLTKYHA